MESGSPTAFSREDGAHLPQEPGQAADDLLPLVYNELRRLAADRLAEFRPGQTLQPTALVHEAYLRLVKDGDPGWNGRGHFFGAASRAMRNILVEHARARKCLKRGGDLRRVDLEDGPADAERDAERDADRTLELDRLIQTIDRIDPRKAELAMLYLFVGMTHIQIAEALGVTVRTVERDWRFTRALMQQELERSL